MQGSRVRLTVRRMMVIVVGVAIGLGAFLWMVRKPTFILEPEAPPRWANPDHEIYDMVLSDLIGNPEFDLTISQSGPKKT